MLYIPEKYSFMWQALSAKNIKNIFMEHGQFNSLSYIHEDLDQARLGMEFDENNWRQLNILQAYTY